MEEVSMEDYYHMKAISDAVKGFLREWIPKWEQNQRVMQETKDRIGHAENTLFSTSLSQENKSELAKELAHDKDAYLDAQSQYNSNPEYGLLEKLFAAWTTGAASGIKNARFFADHGLVTIPLCVFQAINVAGAKSGLGYRGSKDTMHFEIRGDPRDFLDANKRRARGLHH
jgi:hypothetical protein